MVGVVLACTLILDIMLVVHILGDLLSMATSLDSVVLIHSLGLSKLVDLTTHKASEEFLGELVRDRFACTMSGLETSTERWKGLAFFPLAVLEELHALE